MEREAERVGRWERAGWRLGCAREEHVPDVQRKGHAGGHEQSADEGTSVVIAEKGHGAASRD